MRNFEMEAKIVDRMSALGAKASRHTAPFKYQSDELRTIDKVLRGEETKVVVERHNYLMTFAHRKTPIK